MDQKTIKRLYQSCVRGDRCRDVVRRAYGMLGKRYRPSRLSGRTVLSAEEGNARLFDLVSEGKPFAAVRFGANELTAFAAAKAVEAGILAAFPGNVLDQMTDCAGFFPRDPALMDRYASLVGETARSIDYLSVLAFRFESFMLDTCVRADAVVADNRSMEPYYMMGVRPWTKALEGRKVLVIHPFAASVRSQYARRASLFPNPDILPALDLHTLRAVQSLDKEDRARFADWFEALEYMYEEALKIPFDTAILGCGAYGQPLACMLRKAGKQAVHMGGATQILFGIKGRRWERIPEVASLFNDAWVRPLEEEVPSGASKVENACYW